MAKNDKAREMAEQIQAWRGEGLTDAKIIAKHGSDDLSAGYRFKMFNDKVRANVQLNVRNAFEDGRLQAVAANPDGSIYAWRIVEPRRFILSASFDL